MHRNTQIDKQIPRFDTVVIDDVDRTVRIGRVVIECFEQAAVTHTEKTGIQLHQATAGAHIAHMSFERQNGDLVTHHLADCLCFFPITTHAAQTVSVDVAYLGRRNIGRTQRTPQYIYKGLAVIGDAPGVGHRSRGMTYDLSQNLGAPAFGHVQGLQHQATGPFPKHHAATVQIERATGSLRISSVTRVIHIDHLFLQHHM